MNSLDVNLSQSMMIYQVDNVKYTRIPVTKAFYTMSLPF